MATPKVRKRRLNQIRHLFAMPTAWQPAERCPAVAMTELFLAAMNNSG
jgi:hypothetical protein